MKREIVVRAISKYIVSVLIKEILVLFFLFFFVFNMMTPSRILKAQTFNRQGRLCFRLVTHRESLLRAVLIYFFTITLSILIHNDF